MISIRCRHLMLAGLVAALLMTVVVPVVDAGLPRATRYRAGGAITLDTNLLSVSGASAWAIDEYLKATTSLPALGTAFLGAEKRYGINARFLLAAALHESGWGTGYISRTKHNLFGYNAYDRDPVRFATAFSSYAASIDTTAKFMKESYLSASGRWWGGRPTLRSMQQFWSSSRKWGIGVSQIATAIHLHSFAGRAFAFAVPVVKGPLHGQSKTSVRLAWAGGHIPARVEFVARWETIALDSDVVAATVLAPFTAGSAFAYPMAPPPTVARVSPPAPPPDAPDPTSPTNVAAPRVRTGARWITVAVATPRRPGRYRLHVEMVDTGGRPLPAAEKVDIPSVQVRVWSDRAVRYDLAPSLDGTGVVLRITNTGLEAIPAAPVRTQPASGVRDVESPRSVVTLTASTNEPNPLSVQLLASPLVETLQPGASVSFDVPGIAAATGRITNSLSVDLTVLGDPTWLHAHSPTGAWFWDARNDAPGPTGTAGSDGAAPSELR